MSFSPLTGLVYIPIQDAGFPYKSDADFHTKTLGFDVGIDFAAAGMPQDPAIKKAIMNSVRGRLVAWDPIRQKQAWDVDRPEAWNGGVVSTAGNLVFEGTAQGKFRSVSGGYRRESLVLRDTDGRDCRAGHLHGERRAVCGDFSGVGRSFSFGCG